MPQYSKLQLVAYEALTLSLSAPGNIAVPSATGSTDPLLDTRHLSNADARNRLSRFYQVIEHARTTGAAKLGGSDTLKVCIAPEFYFRDAGSNEGYTDQSIVNNLFAAMLSMFKQDNYKDWLFVPGSIFWSNTTPQPAYFNTVCVVRGRSADFPSGTGTTTGIPVVKNGTTNQKALMSRIDYGFDPATGHPIDKRTDDGAVNVHFSPIIGDWLYKKGHVFEVQDILGPKGKPLVFGLEVCLEHAAHLVGAIPTDGGVLKETLGEWSKNEAATPVPAIDVHILTSCGMEVELPSVCARAGGYVLWCDGHPAYPTHSAVRPVTSNNGNAAVLAPSVAEATHVDVQGPLLLNNGGTQTVRIYNAVALQG